MVTIRSGLVDPAMITGALESVLVMSVPLGAIGSDGWANLCEHRTDGLGRGSNAIPIGDRIREEERASHQAFFNFFEHVDGGSHACLPFERWRC